MAFFHSNMHTVLAAALLCNLGGMTSFAFAADEPSKPSFSLKSDDLKEGAPMSADQEYSDFGCTGANLSPALSWEGASEKTKSYAVTMYDPDAPTGSGWWHWVVYNLPAETTALPRGIGAKATLPAGATEGINDYGKHGFGGACPPKGDKPHRYITTLYALDVMKLELPENASPAMVGYNLNAHAVAKRKITARYGR